jgi:hypothetical protein
VSVLAVLLCLWGGENRLWHVELELSGACEELRLECGSDGATHLLGPFPGAGERRVLAPLPLRSPLGAAGLGALPLPRVVALPSGSTASVRALALVAHAPAERLERLAGSLLARPRPPSSPRLARAARGELALVLVAGGFLLGARRRPWLALALGLAAALAAGALARGRTASAEPVRLLDWEAGGELALAVTAAAGELPLPRERLEVLPEGAALEIEALAAGGGRVRAPGARLFGLEGVPLPPLSAAANGGEDLAAVWTRDERGAWRARGAWRGGEPLPEAGAGGDPPGWLASALPPGRTVLLARSASGAWLRCLGFELE